jgi:transcriptional regulator with XRE-family HTH domain
MHQMLGNAMINEALRLIRVFHDLKQFELAERLKVSKSYISEIETGTKAPSLDLIEKYSVEFRIPVSAIMFFAEELPTAKRGEKTRTKIASKVIDLLGFIERKADASAA